MWKANGNLNPCTKGDEILHVYLRQGNFGACLTPGPSPPGFGGPKPLKAEGHIFENSLQNKRCSAGCKLTWAAPGISASK